MPRFSQVSSGVIINSFPFNLVCVLIWIIKYMVIASKNNCSFGKLKPQGVSGRAASSASPGGLPAHASIFPAPGPFLPLVEQPHWAQQCLCQLLTHVGSQTSEGTTVLQLPHFSLWVPGGCLISPDISGGGAWGQGSKLHREAEGWPVPSLVHPFRPAWLWA